MRRGKETDLRRSALEAQREALVGERNDLAQRNRLRQRVAGFAGKIAATIDKLDFVQRQQLLRLIVEQVLVVGWQVEIKLRIPLDSPPGPPGGRVSSKDRLRSLHAVRRQELAAQRIRRASCQGPPNRVIITPSRHCQVEVFDPGHKWPFLRWPTGQALQLDMPLPAWDRGPVDRSHGFQRCIAVA